MAAQEQVNRERDAVLGVARWGFLAWHTDAGPRVAPHALWSDGAGVWLALPVGGEEVVRLRAVGSCALWIPPVDDGAPGVALAGRARVFGLDDPLSLVVHGPVISLAVAALAARSPGLVLDQARAIASFPPRLLRNRAVVRIAIERLAGVQPPPAAGMAPALPPDIPADLRRNVGGVRDGALALAQPSIRVVAVSVGAGFSLSAPEPLTTGQRVSLGLVSRRGDEAAPDEGVALDGVLTDGPALRVEQARWWVSGRAGAARISGGVVLPE